MPFCAIPFDKSKIAVDLGVRFEVEGYPTLLILNAEDGSLVDAEGRATVTSAKGNTSKCLTKWGC